MKLIAQNIIRADTKLRKLLRYTVSTIDYTLWKIFDKTKNKKQKTKIKRILIILLNQEKGNVGGDFCTLGVLNQFKKLHSHIELTLLSDEKTLKQFQTLKHNIQTTTYKKKSDIQKLKTKNYDAAIFMNIGGLPPKLFSFIPQRVGISTVNWKGLKKIKQRHGYTHFSYIPFTKHMVDFRMHLFELLGFTFTKRELFLEPKEKEKKNIEKFIQKNKIKKPILIHPGGKYVVEGYKKGNTPPHLWPIKNYAKVAQELINKGHTPIITGSKNESILAEDIIKHIEKKEKIINGCGVFNLGEMVALLQKTKLLIATDTSIVHLAYPVKTPIVELMGPSVKETVGAWPTNSPRHIILEDKGPCYQSMRKKESPKGIICLEKITVKEVLQAANKLLKKN